MPITRDAVFERMREFFQDEQAVDADRFTEAARIREDLETDSLDFIAFTIVVEDLLDGAAMPEAELVRVVTVGDAIDLVLVAHATADLAR